MEQPELRIEVMPSIGGERGVTERADKFLEDAPQRFESLGVAIGQAANRFWDALATSMDKKPSEVVLELNVGFELGGSWVVVSGKATANAAVKLTWK